MKPVARSRVCWLQFSVLQAEATIWLSAVLVTSEQDAYVRSAISTREIEGGDRSTPYRNHRFNNFVIGIVVCELSLLLGRPMRSELMSDMKWCSRLARVMMSYSAVGL